MTEEYDRKSFSSFSFLEITTGNRTACNSVSRRKVNWTGHRGACVRDQLEKRVDRGGIDRSPRKTTKLHVALPPPPPDDVSSRDQSSIT